MASSIEVLVLAKLSFYDNKPTCRVYNNAGFSVVNNSVVTMPWDTSVDDNLSGHSNVTNNTRYTVQVAGYYQVSGSVNFANNTTGYRLATWLKNGTELPAARGFGNPNITTWTCTVVPPTIGVQCAVGDYLEMAVYQNSGGSLSTTAASAGIGGNTMQIQFLHF